MEKWIHEWRKSRLHSLVKEKAQIPMKIDAFAMKVHFTEQEKKERKFKKIIYILLYENIIIRHKYV